MFEDQLEAIPKHPPRSLSLLPGLKFRSAISGSSLAVPLFFVGIFFLFPLIFILEDPGARLAVGETRVVEGEITEAAKSRACQNSGRALAYRIAINDGPEYLQRQTVCPSSPYFDVSPGDEVPVRYLVSDPSISTIDAERGVNQAPIGFLFIFPFFALFFFAPFLLPSIRRLLRARKLFKRGIITKAVVVFVKKRSFMSWPGWPGSSTADLHVSFTPTSGGSVEAILKCDNDWLIGQLSNGNEVHIAYLPSKPQNAILVEAYIR